MTTVLFVHGTGVRAPSYDARFVEVSARLERIRPGWSVERCYWGDAHGARLHADGASIPDTSGRGVEDFRDADGVALWWALAQDPLFELRLIAAQEAGIDDEPPPNVKRPGRRLLAAVDALAAGQVVDAVVDAGLADVLPDSVREVLDDEVTRPLILASRSVSLADPLARAIVAQVMTDSAGTAAVTELDGNSRDELVKAVALELSDNTARGVGGNAFGVAFKLAMKAGGSRFADRQRAAWSSAGAPLAGDILVYLTRGGGIKDFIADRLVELEGPVVVLAHSLGGIAALELLATQSFPQVQQLITVGSQAPLFYELDALPSLRYNDPLPTTVPHWTNIYDPRDLLGYIGAGVFPGRVEDHAVNNRAPFPWAHTTYFAAKNDRFYQLLDQVLI
ncbi:hypothetical protein [Nocardia salmonicida]|uniref:hypothetical protein n=1 Tax=Nocardia salmonicida TaxID=53431 RepID=UPI00340CEBFE